MPDNVTTLGYGVFQYCESLSDVALSNNLEKIPIGTFAFCTSLTEITIPRSVSTIGTKSTNTSGLIYTDIKGVEITNGAFVHSSLSKAYFEETTGWYRLYNSSWQDVSESVLENPTNAATLLMEQKYSYDDNSAYSWHRNKTSSKD